MRDHIKEKGLSGEEEYDRATWIHKYRRQTLTPHKSGIKMKRKESKKVPNDL